MRKSYPTDNTNPLSGKFSGQVDWKKTSSREDSGGGRRGLCNTEATGLQQALQQAPARLTRQRRLDSKPCLAMLSNPHFREVLAPLKLAAQGARYRATQPLAA